MSAQSFSTDVKSLSSFYIYFWSLHTVTLAFPFHAGSRVPNGYLRGCENNSAVNFSDVFKFSFIIISSELIQSNWGDQSCWMRKDKMCRSGHVESHSPLLFVCLFVSLIHTLPFCPIEVPKLALLVFIKYILYPALRMRTSRKAFLRRFIMAVEGCLWLNIHFNPVAPSSCLTSNPTTPNSLSICIFLPLLHTLES